MKFLLTFLLTAIVSLAVLVSAATEDYPMTELNLSQSDLDLIGRKIWKNEANGSVTGLTHWNASEGFASLGIGHFIWFPKNKKFPFKESFPQVIKYIQTQNVDVPLWLIDSDCPWQSHDEFVAAADSPRMNELRTFLASTFSLQLNFIVQRSQNALQKMVSVSEFEDRERLRKNYYAMAQSPQGLYALIDYTNFKGEGILNTEQYNGQGWGLKDVLLGMKDSENILKAFSLSAQKVLLRRVKNGPAKEAQWLAGWMKRCKGYEQVIF
jgi:hypothetical protein